MSAPSFVRSNYSDLFGSGMLPVLEEMFRSELDLHPSRRSELFKMVSTDRDIYQSSELHDMPLFNEVPEGTDYTYSRPKQGANKTMSIVKYGSGFSISEEAVADGRFDFIADAVRKMAESAQESQEISAMNIFNNGFGTENTPDGQDIFSTAHTLPSGLTWANRPATDVDLSVSALDQALKEFEINPIGDSGIVKRIQPKILLVHPSQKRYAMELIGSDLKADTSDNNMNSFKQDGLRVISSPHITDTDSWFLLADPSKTGFRIVVREALTTKSDEAFDNDSIKYKARYREALGCVSAYGAWATTGV